MPAFVAPVVIVCILLAAGLLTVGAAGTGLTVASIQARQDRCRENNRHGRQGRENDRRGRQGRENDRNRRAEQPPEALLGERNNQHAEQPPPQAPPLGREVEDSEDRHGEGPGAGELTRRERARYNEHGGEERQMEVMILAPPTAGCDCPIPGDAPRADRAEAGELTRRHNGVRIGYNAYGRQISSSARGSSTTQSGCGGMKDGAGASASASLRSQSCSYETHRALGLAQNDPTLELKKFCGGNQTTREEHYTCMEIYLKNCEKDGGKFCCTQVTLRRCIF